MMKKLVIILMCILLVGCSNQSNQKEEDLKDRIEWSEESKKIDSLKTMTLSSYPDVTIEEAMKDKNEKWSYGKEDKTDYLRCDFVLDDQNSIIIFYLDEYDNMNVAKYYINNKKQTKETIQQLTDTYFVKKEEIVENNNQSNEQSQTQTQNQTTTTNTQSSLVGQFEANYMIPDGDYYNSPDGGWPNMCMITIRKSSSNSFKFTIYRVFDENGNSCHEKIFNEHEAVFETYDCRSAIYRGKQYTIYFFCNYMDSFNISGFGPAEEAGDLYSTGGSDSFGY